MQDKNPELVQKEEKVQTVSLLIHSRSLYLGRIGGAWEDPMSPSKVHQLNLTGYTQELQQRTSCSAFIVNQKANFILLIHSTHLWRETKQATARLPHIKHLPCAKCWDRSFTLPGTQKLKHRGHLQWRRLMEGRQRRRISASTDPEASAGKLPTALALSLWS